MVDHRITDKVMIVAEDAKALAGLDIRELGRPSVEAIVNRPFGGSRREYGG